MAPRFFASKTPQNTGEGAFEAKERWLFVVLAFCSFRGAAGGVTWRINHQSSISNRRP